MSFLDFLGEDARGTASDVCPDLASDGNDDRNGDKNSAHVERVCHLSYPLFSCCLVVVKL